MNRREFISSAVAVAAVKHFFPVDPMESDIGDFAALWPLRGSFFHRALHSGSGFSFHSNGNIVEKPVQIDHGNGTNVAETVFRFSSGVEVIRSAVALPEYDAVEFSVRFRGFTVKPSPLIESINVLDISFSADVIESTALIFSGGGMIDGIYPPATYAIHEAFFDPTVPAHGAHTLTTKGGRSSNLDLPFFFIPN